MYILVDENLRKEVDVSASFCIPINAKFMKHSLDTNKEQWDVIDDYTLPLKKHKG